MVRAWGGSEGVFEGEAGVDTRAEAELAGKASGDGALDQLSIEGGGGLLGLEAGRGGVAAQQWQWQCNGNSKEARRIMPELDMHDSTIHGACYCRYSRGRGLRKTSPKSAA